MEEYYEKVLAQVLCKKYHELFDIAKKQFVLEEDESDFVGLDEWYVFNFQNPTTGRTMIEDYVLEHPNSEESVLNQSFRSIFDIRVEKNRMVVKDIFTKEDYILDSGLSSEEGLVSIRLVKTSDDTFDYFGECFTFEPLYKETIYKHIMNHYNQYVSAFGHVSFDVFLIKQGHLIYKMLTIINQLYDHQYSEEELQLFEGVYLYKMTDDALLDKLMELNLRIHPDEDDELVFRVYSEESVIAELELMNPKLHVLCNQQSHLDQMIEAIKPLLDESFVFLNAQILEIDSLLDD